MADAKAIRRWLLALKQQLFIAAACGFYCFRRIGLNRPSTPVPPRARARKGP